MGRPKKFNDMQKQQIVNLYKEGNSFITIAEIMKCSGGSISNILIEKGIKRRTISETNYLFHNTTKENSNYELSKKVRNLPENTFWKAKIMVRDNFTCQICNKCNTNPKEAHIEIHVDHIKPFNEIIKDNNITSIQEARECEELWNIENGRILCKDCHYKEGYIWRRLKP